MTETNPIFQITPALEDVKILYNWHRQLLKIANRCKAKADKQMVTLVVIFEPDGCIRFSTGEPGGRISIS